MISQNSRKLKDDQRGFSLTEVMIGMMVLTVAIVAATNLLVGHIRSNLNASNNLQAYYLAQEGIEGVRNLRDSNWLHNTDWLGADSIGLWGEKLNVDEDIVHDLILEPEGWTQPPKSGSVGKIDNLSSVKPWSLGTGEGKIIKYYGNQGNFLSSALGIGGEQKDTGFIRKIYILPYMEDCNVGVDCDDFVLVRSVVSWDDGEMILEAILSDWKGGAL